MAVARILKSNGLAATKLRLIGAVGIAAMALPSAAIAQERGDVRARWESRGGEQVQARDSERGGWNRGGNGASNNGGGWSQRPQAAPSVQAPAPQPQAAPQQRSWNGGGGGWNGGNGGGWQARQQATPAPAPVAQPAQTGWNGGNRGNGGGGWQGRTEPAPQTQAPVPAPAPQARGNWNGGQMGGGNWNTGSNNTGWPRNPGWEGRTSAPQQQQRNDGWRGNDRDRNEGWRDNNNQRRPDGWRGSDSWRGNDSWRGRDNDRRNDNWRSSSGWRENNHRDWNRGWRNDNRYNWNVWRSYHRDVFRVGRYYPPYHGYSYRRLSIGFTLNSLFFGDDYWINDPWSYRLPEAYGPYRWVRYYDDAILVNIYTGQVEDVIYDFFW